MRVYFIAIFVMITLFACQEDQKSRVIKDNLEADKLNIAVFKRKGVIRISAGAYLLSSTPGYPNLKIASSIHIDRAHYNRGRGLIEFNLNDKGLDIFPELKDHKLFTQYYDGPVLVKSDSKK